MDAKISDVDLKVHRRNLGSDSVVTFVHNHQLGVFQQPLR